MCVLCLYVRACVRAVLVGIAKNLSYEVPVRVLPSFRYVLRLVVFDD